jgi:transposase
MHSRFYDTDLTNAAWARVAPVLPAARPGGRPRTTNLRAVLNAIFYLLGTGCQWRLLPREFPPCGTVYHYFQAWQNSGVWVHLHRVLYGTPPLLGKLVALLVTGSEKNEIVEFRFGGVVCVAAPTKNGKSPGWLRLRCFTARTVPRSSGRT